jgi:hypothetical protein
MYVQLELVDVGRNGSTAVDLSRLRRKYQTKTRTAINATTPPTTPPTIAPTGVLFDAGPLGGTPVDEAEAEEEV